MPKGAIHDLVLTKCKVETDKIKNIKTYMTKTKKLSKYLTIK